VPKYDDREPLEDAIRGVFPKADPKVIRALLGRARDGAGGLLAERVQLACVLLSAGDVGRLQHYLREASGDARDVLYWAFYYDDEPPAHMRAHLRR
jgi:hypothetical protein